MTATWADRIKHGELHESEFGRWLRDSQGWDAWQFGQALIPDEARESLHRWRDTFQRPTRIRWLPDLLAVNPASGEICLVDPKSETDDYPNFSIETDALETGQVIVDYLHTPVYYAFRGKGENDFPLLTPRVAGNRWHTRKDGAGSRGSRTSFVLVSKSYGVPAFRVFPKAGR